MAASSSSIPSDDAAVARRLLALPHHELVARLLAQGILFNFPSYTPTSLTF
jgi:hypothetical protein